MVDDYPKDYNGHVFKNSNRTYNGLVTIRKGITSSLNVVAVKTMEMTGIDTCYKFAQGLDSPNWLTPTATFLLHWAA